MGGWRAAEGVREGGSRGRRGTGGRVYVLKKERKKWRASWRKRTDVMNLQTGEGKKKRRRRSRRNADLGKHAANELICCIPPFFSYYLSPRLKVGGGGREREKKKIHTDLLFIPTGK